MATLHNDVATNRRATRLTIRRLGVTAACVAMAALQLAPARASIIQLTSRSQVGANVTVDWSAFGRPGTTVITPLSQQFGPVQVGVSATNGALGRSQEGAGFIGDFTKGQQLLTDGGSESDLFIVNFNGPVEAVGTQIAPHYFTGQFIAGMELFSHNTLLGRVSVTGDAMKAEDGSATFIGARSDSFNITSIDFTLVQANGLPPRAGPVAINQLDILADPPARIPEPPMVAIMAGALLSIASIRVRR